MHQAASLTTYGCPSCPMRGCGVCRMLSEAELSSIGIIGRAVPAGQDLFSQGEPCGDVFNILDGWVFLYELLEDGRRQILQFGLPGDFIGLRPSGRVPFFGAQALSQVSICAIPRHRLLDLARRRPELAFELVRIVASDESQAYERLTALGRKTAVERVATLLLELFYRIRRRAPQAAGEILRIPLTQTHLADALGLTPVHINRTLGVLRQRGVIDYGNGLFHILAPHRLFEIAGVDAETCPWPRGDDGSPPSLQ